MINEMKFMTLLWIYAETTETTPCPLEEANTGKRPPKHQFNY